MREKYMFDLPIIIRTAVFSFLKPRCCTDFVNYLRRKVLSKQMFLIDNYLNRERKNFDEGGASFYWNVQQMKEIYNFNNDRICHQYSGIVNVCDQAGNVFKEVFTDRSGKKNFFDKKISISYIYDVYKEKQYLGNVNNIKLKG